MQIKASKQVRFQRSSRRSPTAAGGITSARFGSVTLYRKARTAGWGRPISTSTAVMIEGVFG
jgi:hypothetical protein